MSTTSVNEVDIRQPSWHTDQSVVPEGAKKFSEVKHYLNLNWDLYRRQRTDKGAEKWADIVRSDTGQVVYPGASRSFKLVTIEDFGRYVETSIKGNIEWDTFHIFDGGAAMASTIKLDEPLKIVGDDSPLFPYVGFMNRVDGKGSLLSLLAVNRMSCSNMVSAMMGRARRHGGLIRFTHSGKFNLDRAIGLTQRMLQAERELSREYVVQASLLNERVVNVKTFVDKWLPLSTDLTERQTNYVEKRRGEFHKALNGKYAVKRTDTAWAVLQAAISSYQYSFPVKGDQGRERRTMEMMGTLHQQDQLRKAYRIALDLPKVI